VDEIDKFVQKANSLVFEQTHDEILAGKVEILFSEFLNNIAIHGLGQRNAKRPIISVHIEFHEEDIMIVVCDQGKAWDMQLGETSNTLTDNFFSDLKNRRLEFHGRGLHLLKSISKSITRSRYADTLNETIFLINYK
jgi:anti-sigma regulatory factor (Ser/Thr protein kinase)